MQPLVGPCSLSHFCDKQLSIVQRNIFVNGHDDLCCKLLTDAADLACLFDCRFKQRPCRLNTQLLNEAAIVSQPLQGSTKSSTIHISATQGLNKQ